MESVTYVPEDTSLNRKTTLWILTLICAFMTITEVSADIRDGMFALAEAQTHICSVEE